MVIKKIFKTILWIIELFLIFFATWSILCWLVPLIQGGADFKTIFDFFIQSWWEGFKSLFGIA